MTTPAIASAAEDFPPELLGADKLDQVIAFLRAIPLPLPSKRQKLRMWAKAHALELDRSYYDRLGPIGGVQ